MLRILLINGSASPDSRTLALLKHIETLLVEKNVSVTLWDLQKKPIPVVDPAYHEDPSQSPSRRVRDFVRVVNESDAVVLGTPLYHGSFSGLLKNALDNLSSDALKNKFVGLVANSGGNTGVQALDQMRSVVRCLYGYTLQTQISTSEDDYEMADLGSQLRNNELKSRCERMVDEVLLLSSFMRKSKSYKYNSPKAII